MTPAPFPLFFAVGNDPPPRDREATEGDGAAGRRLLQDNEGDADGVNAWAGFEGALSPEARQSLELFNPAELAGDDGAGESGPLLSAMRCLGCRLSVVGCQLSDAVLWLVTPVIVGCCLSSLTCTISFPRRRSSFGLATLSTLPPQGSLPGK